MFCGKCGREMMPNEQFCGNCGTPVCQTNQQLCGTNSVQTHSTDITRPKIAPGVHRLPIGNTLRVAMIIAAVMYIIMIILRFVPFGSGTARVQELHIYSDGAYSIYQLMGAGVETVLFIIASLLSMVLCILPVIKNKLGRGRMIISKLVAFWNALAIVVCAWGLADWAETNRYRYSEYSIDIFWKLLFGGWINIIVTLITVALLFFISYKAKNRLQIHKEEGIIS